VTGLWFSPGLLVSSSNKTDYQDISEILLKVALNTIKSKAKKKHITELGRQIMPPKLKSGLETDHWL
jgi:hypothetical protein